MRYTCVIELEQHVQMMHYRYALSGTHAVRFKIHEEGYAHQLLLLLLLSLMQVINSSPS